MRSGCGQDRRPASTIQPVVDHRGIGRSAEACRRRQSLASPRWISHGFATPLQVSLRLAFAVVVCAAAVVDVWVIRQMSFIDLPDISRAALVVVVTAAFGIAWAAWPHGALPLAVVASMLALAETAEPSLRGHASGSGCSPSSP